MSGKSGFGRGCLILLLLGMVRASAATTVISPAGVEIEDAELFKPTVDPGPFLSVYHSATVPRGSFSIGYFQDYANEPLDARRVVGGRQENIALLDHLSTIGLLGSVGVLDRVHVGAHLPFYLTGGHGLVIAHPTPTRESGVDANLGDLALNVKVNLLPETRSRTGFGLALVPMVGLPTGNRRGFAGTGKLSGGGVIAADFASNRWRFGANLGGSIRDGVGGRGGGDGFEDQIRYGVAVAYSGTPRSSVIAELFGATDAGSPFDEEYRSPAEMIGALRFGVGSLDVTLGAGGGLNSGKNAPFLRFVFGLASAVTPPAAAGRAELSASRKTYVVEDYDRNGRVSPGDVIVYTITLVNGGAASADDVLVTDPIPAGTQFVPGSIRWNGEPVGDADGYSSGPPRIETRISVLPATAGANHQTIAFKARIATDLGSVTSIRNAAGVQADGSSFSLPVVDTQVFPVTAEREHVIETPTQTAAKRKLEVTQNIQFEPNSATIRRESFAVLDEVASVLTERATLEITIVGHTDSTGSAGRNLELSQARADAVKSYLVGKGVASTRMDALGRGAEEPVATNETQPGRAANRRVEFVVVRGQ